MFELPTSVFIDGTEYPIRNKGDFRMVLDCFVALDDSELDSDYRVLTSLLIFYDGMQNEEDVWRIFGKEHIEEAIKKMFEFFNCNQPNAAGAVTKHKLVNWETDAQLIAGAVNKVANKEVRAESYLHWWTFMGYYLNIGDSAFSTIVGIRNKVKTGKKLEKHEQEFKRDNPQYFVWDSQTTEDIQMNDYLRELWENGG
jgi:hypothetical protein